MEDSKQKKELQKNVAKVISQLGVAFQKLGDKSVDFNKAFNCYCNIIKNNDLCQLAIKSSSANHQVRFAYVSATNQVKGAIIKEEQIERLLIDLDALANALVMGKTPTAEEWSWYISTLRTAQTLIVTLKS